jgi:hypothetical protein
MMYLDRTPEDLDGYRLDYWKSHFFSCDNIEREEALWQAIAECSTWEETLSVARSMPWAVDPELSTEDCIPYKINNFFSSGDMCAADVMLDAAWEAHGRGASWLGIIQAVDAAEKAWRRNERAKSAILSAVL